ncbi:hypothetical protein HRbin17_01085 [bacterium HR17]|uniref:Polymerase/histidinol phosphatase N-terminal domain-containing protein n=1 Tax=Candidatus Fervidibacter japonicus TaxID=2035412 RepID=A0A2H5XBL0_9BACT|nr:hypothetical protein HRbin17_01085 [bacterium HR17]
MVRRGVPAISVILALQAVVVAQRVCQSPDALFVDSTASARTLHMFIYVPPSTPSFTLAVFDQADDSEVAQPSVFTLHAPNGSVAMQLNKPQRKAWSEYAIAVGPHWGIWRLTVTGPQAPSGARQPARNFFLVRTVGEVDLYFKPEPVVLARGLRFAEPQFGGPPVHQFTVQVPALERVRFNFRRPQDRQTVQVELTPPSDVAAQQRWGGLPRGSLEFLEVTGTNLQGLWRLTVRDVKGVYALGIEQELRLFCTDRPLMPMPYRAVVGTFVAGENTLVPARLDVTAPQTATESYVAYTDRIGLGVLFLLPGITYRVTASRGIEFEPQGVMVTDAQGFSVPLRRRWVRPAGWYCGDNHVHTVYSDGNDTPAQMVEAARGEGLDWVTLTDHGVGPVIQQVLIAHQEALPLSEPGRFIVIPGEEFTTPNYHANVINGTVLELPTAPLQQVIDAVLKMDRPDRPITVKLNHPTWEGTAKAADLARRLERLPLIELWNSREPEAMRLWWELLNKGMRVFAETSTDTHNRKTARLGHRRTYIYLGDTPLTAENIVRALREGRSFLSRGAFLLFAADGALPGDTIASPPSGEIAVKVRVLSAVPVDRIEFISEGALVRTVDLGGRLEWEGELRLAVKGRWVLAQAMEKDNPVPLAMTNPIFVRR